MQDKKISVVVGLALTLWFAPTAWARMPDWMRDAARTTLPQMPSDTEAVCLLSEQTTEVHDSANTETTYRSVYKILRPKGRNRGRVVVYFDNDSKIESLKGWSLQPNGTEYEVKEKDAVEASLPGAGILYESTRYKILIIPAAEPDNIIGYEYVKRRRPYFLEAIWNFQKDVPVLRARFELHLPGGWEYKPSWAHYASTAPQTEGNNGLVWEFQNLPAVEIEPYMPNWSTLAGRMAVAYLPPGGTNGRSGSSWKEVGLFYDQLAHDRREVTPEIREKVSEVTARAATPMDKIRVVAEFVQHSIRYVGIEIGIGGYQPHPAATVLADKYGDCKDKVTLLSAMLKALGVDSYYVLVNTQRGAVVPEMPIALTFNHVIVAIKLPASTDKSGLFASVQESPDGMLLLFDPTDDLTAFGFLPPPLQAGYALLVTPKGGQLIQLPLLLPSLNRLLRSGKLAVNGEGEVAGAIQEVRWGTPAYRLRARVQDVAQAQRPRILEKFLGQNVGGLTLQDFSFENVENPAASLVVGYKFLAANYAKRAGDLMLLRLALIGESLPDLRQEAGKARKSPVEFPGTSLDTDMFEIALPAGYAVDELPSPVDIKSPFGEYVCKIEVEGNVLKYQRKFEISSVLVPAERVDQLKKFFGQISLQERAVVVLKQVSPNEPAQRATIQ